MFFQVILYITKLISNLHFQNFLQHFLVNRHFQQNNINLMANIYKYVDEFVTKNHFIKGLEVDSFQILIQPHTTTACFLLMYSRIHLLFVLTHLYTNEQKFTFLFYIYIQIIYYIYFEKIHFRFCF